MGGMAQGVVEREDEGKERLGGLVMLVCYVTARHAHHGRGPAALDVLGDAVEDGYAGAQGEHQHRQQRAHRLDAPCPPPYGRAGLGPRLFSGRPARAIAERDGNVSRREVRWCGAVAVSPGLNCDDGEARQQQHDGDGVQRLVQGERVVDGRRGAEVSGC